MIYGIGIDIVKINRIRDAVGRWGDSFLKKVFTDKEIEYCYKKKVPFLSLAVRFAAKEAAIKAVSSPRAVSLKEIEVVTSERGRPSLIVHGKTKDLFDEKGISGVHVSLSHEREFGIASVVLEVVRNVPER